VTPDEWTQVRALFDAAIEMKPAEREAFVHRACPDQPHLRAELKSLLEAHDGTGALLDAPVYEAAADLLVDDPRGSLEGRVVGPYIVRQEIGRGGMGIVYLAEDTRLARRVALKAIPPGIAHDAVRRDRLRLEARAAATLSHPGIATVYSLDEIDGELYLATEYVPGQTLRVLAQSGPLPPTQTVDLALQLARALEAAHLAGVVHRDLKPENLIRTPAGALKVLDFGIARVDGLPPASIGAEGAGTPSYMSPEQVRGQPIDFRSDLFSFGVLVYEMAAGVNPFRRGSLGHGRPLSEISPDSDLLDPIVARCLRDRPSDRYVSTHDLVVDLERAHEELSRRPRPLEVDRHRITGQAARPALGTRTWWVLHQLLVSIVDVLMLVPVWRVREWLPGGWGLAFLFIVLACTAAATSMRLHLWFTARVYPVELAAQRTRVVPWTRMSDLGLTIAFLAAAVWIGGEHPGIATLLVVVAISTSVASWLIEPATTRAAFGRGEKSGA
jgi:hypothetical protein